MYGVLKRVREGLGALSTGGSKPSPACRDGCYRCGQAGMLMALHGQAVPGTAGMRNRKRGWLWGESRLPPPPTLLLIHPFGVLGIKVGGSSILEKGSSLGRWLSGITARSFFNLWGADEVLALCPTPNIVSGRKRQQRFLTLQIHCDGWPAFWKPCGY